MTGLPDGLPSALRAPRYDVPLNANYMEGKYLENVSFLGFGHQLERESFVSSS